MREDELQSLLHNHGLSRIATELVALAAPTLRVYITPSSDEALPIGQSKLGGRPDLPRGVDWPSWHEPMAFIGQFNLAEAAPFDREKVLPSQGLLSFYYETDGEPLYSARWGLPDGTDPDDYPQIDESLGWRVLYHPEDPATFTRATMPDTLNEAGRFRPCSARFASEVTLPDVDGPEIWPLGLTSAERNALIDLNATINQGTWEAGGHHLLGYPYNLQGPTLVTCDVEARGAADEWAEAPPERRREIERDVAHRWRLLLQVSSSDATGMDWAGGGLLYYCIEPAALRAQDFSRVWLTMEFL